MSELKQVRVVFFNLLAVRYMYMYLVTFDLIITSKKKKKIEATALFWEGGPEKLPGLIHNYCSTYIAS